jgi:hypothetical protein
MADFKHLIAATKGLEAMLHNNQDKKGAEIKTIQEKMKVQVGSLASWMDANQEEMKEKIKSGQAKMKARVNTILQKIKSW